MHPRNHNVDCVGNVYSTIDSRVHKIVLNSIGINHQLSSKNILIAN